MSENISDQEMKFENNSERVLFEIESPNFKLKKVKKLIKSFSFNVDSLKEICKDIDESIQINKFYMDIFPPRDYNIEFLSIHNQRSENVKGFINSYINKKSVI